MAKTRGCPHGYCDKCNKTAHMDRDAACAHRRSLIESDRHSAKPGKLEVYPCPYGHGFHVGHLNHR